MTAEEMRSIWSNVVSTANDHLHGVEWSLNETLSILRRRWIVVAASIGACLAIAVLMLLVTPEKYTAQALLQINTRQEQVVKTDEVLGGLTSTDSAVRTELDVITSRKLAGRVVDRLHLLQDADFAHNVSFLGTIKRILTDFLTPVSREVVSATKDNKDSLQDAARSRAVDTLIANMSVQLRPRSFTIVVRYTADTPKLAAQITNAIAQEYLNSQLEDRFDATRRANAWITDRLNQMRKNVEASELAVQKFREQNGLSEAKGVLLTEQQISELNSQLILARTQLAETEAKYGRARQLQASGRGIESAAEVLNSQLIMNLRGQEAELRRNMSELASRYGDKHPRMVNARNELADLRSKIGEEVNKIQGSLENNVAVARARVATLEEQLDALQTKTSLSSDANVQLAELERQATAEKILYESFLNRSKEISQMDFNQTDARVISAADIPNAPSSPNKKLFIAAALVIGTAIGAGLILLLEALDSGFRTATQLENSVGEPVLGMLSELPADSSIANYAVNKPTSAFTEGIRSIRTALQFANPDRETRVVLITSTVPQEGKSLFAISFAQLAAKGGAKVLLVDADLRRPTVTKQLALDTKIGLAEVLVGKAKQKDVLHIMKNTGLTVMPAVSGSQFAQELLTSQKMKDLMAAWRKEFDLIVLDSPPVMAVADSVNLSSLADAVLFLVRWGTTPRTLVANAIKQLRACRVAVSGCIMTRVNLEKQQAYGYGDYGYYHGKYKEYYSE